MSGGLSLRLEDISRSYGAVVAVHPLSLSVAPGELIALLGPSGCGKTTTLRMVAGFESPDTGRILIGDRDVTDMPPNHRGLGMVFQNYGLFPHMSVGANVAFGLRMQRLPAAECTRRAREMLATVRLQNFEDRFPAQLSGGQQQRVALARALVTNPTVLLLDEPLGALDRNLREGMQFELRELQRRLGITSVMVTHDQEEALTMADRVAVMQAGRIVQEGPPAAIYARPRNRFVSEFLGTANVFTVSDLPGHPMPGLPPGCRLIAIRPEHIDLLPPGQGLLQGQIIDLVFRGAYLAFEIAVRGLDRSVIAYTQAGRADAPAPGAEVGLMWEPDATVPLEDDAP
jgi:ABC-type Fe3+/spermidine/putrescine transport system ATPase subunit